MHARGIARREVFRSATARRRGPFLAAVIGGNTSADFLKDSSASDIHQRGRDGPVTSWAKEAMSSPMVAMRFACARFASAKKIDERSAIPEYDFWFYSKMIWLVPRK
jgi:hypothetical protein